MPQCSLPHGHSFLPVPSALVTLAPDGEGRRTFPVGWLGVVCASPPVLTVCIHPQADKQELLRVGDLFSVDLPTEETMRPLNDQRWLVQGEGPVVSGQSSLLFLAEEGRKEPQVAVSPIRIDCRCCSQGVRLSQYWLRGEIVAVYFDGSRQEMTAAVDLCRLMSLQKRHFPRCSAGL